MTYRKGGSDISWGGGGGYNLNNKRKCSGLKRSFHKERSFNIYLSTYLLTYLVALGLSGGVQTPSSSMWDLVP